MFCGKCGKELQEGQNFCTRCGDEVSWPVNETPGMYDSPAWETETRAETPDENHVREDHVPDGGILLGADYFKEILQGRGFYLLPSSIHETILVMDDNRSHERGYSEMIREVNDSVVAENEILSDHAYYYNVEKGVLEAV